MSPGYAEKEIKISKMSKWLFYTLGIEREKTKIDLLKNVLDTINTVKSLVELLNGFENVKLCDGCETTETFKELNLDNENDKSYQRKNGQEGISVEKGAKYTVNGLFSSHQHHFIFLSVLSKSQTLSKNGAKMKSCCGKETRCASARKNKVQLQD